jgi:hypothetical protein
MTETSFWVYPWDLADEGVGEPLRRMRDTAGATTVNVATVYHSGKFLHVHNPKRRVVFPRSGTLYYQPAGSWYGRLRIQPPVWEEAEGFWEELSQEAERLDLDLCAWVLCLHNSGVGFGYPDCAVENAFGDRIFTDLCANSPDVREFLVALLRDVASRLGPDRILLESLEYMPFRHDYHHEVIGVPTGPTVDFLMSLCFCQHCARAAARSGVDLTSVRSWVREVLNRHFADPYGTRTEMSWSELREAAGGEFAGLLELRQTALASLLEEIAGGVRESSSARLALCDFGPLYPNGPDGRAWENGVDLSRHLPLVDEIHPTFYFTDPDLHRQKAEQYVELLAGEKPMVPAIRAILPQTASEEDLRRQLEPLAPHASGFSFYNYGFMPLPTLDWIGAATRQVTDR